MGQEVDDGIRAALREHGPATGPELASALGVHPERVQRRCRTLQKRGEIRLVTGGQYTLARETPTGPRTASD